MAGLEGSFARLLSALVQDINRERVRVAAQRLTNAGKETIQTRNVGLRLDAYERARKKQTAFVERRFLEFIVAAPVPIPGFEDDPETWEHVRAFAQNRLAEI